MIIRATPAAHAHVRDLTNLLRQRRRDTHVGQKKLAQQLGVHPSTLSSWENHDDEPRNANFVRWVRALGQRIVILDTCGSEWKFAGTKEDDDLPWEWIEIERIALALAAMRTSYNLRRSHVAREMGITVHQFCDIENGTALARPVRLCGWALAMGGTIGLTALHPNV